MLREVAVGAGCSQGVGEGNRDGVAVGGGPDGGGEADERGSVGVADGRCSVGITDGSGVGVPGGGEPGGGVLVASRNGGVEVADGHRGVDVSDGSAALISAMRTATPAIRDGSL